MSPQFLTAVIKRLSAILKLDDSFLTSRWLRGPPTDSLPPAVSFTFCAREGFHKEIPPSRSEISANLAWEPVPPRPPKEGTGRSRQPLNDWWTPQKLRPQEPAPLPSPAGCGHSAKQPRPASRADWRPLSAAQLQETGARAVAAAGETQRGEREWEVELSLRGLSFPFGRVETGADSAARLGTAGPERLRIAPRGSSTHSRGPILSPRVRSVD